jgi:3-phosphoshikimate 1-carboxyvinyltransferase
VTRFDPSGSLRGTLRPPPDKSISHRAALIGAMGEGDTMIEGWLDAADTRATLNAIQVLGAEVQELDPSSAAGGNDLRVRGIGLRGPLERFAEGDVPAAIDVKNAGTLLRILPGWLAGQGAGAWTLDGDESIRRRPVDRIAEPLRMMGGRVECRDGRLPPLHVSGSALHGVAYRLPVASAQVKSCVLIAGLLAEGETQVVELAATRDHTERMLAAAGAEVEVKELRSAPAVRSGPLRRIGVRPAERLSPERISVPGDFSSAAFPLVAATLVPSSRVRLEDVGLNPTRIGLLGILNRMGAAVEVDEDLGRGGPEPRGAIVARHGPLAATRVHGEEVPLTIDELPLVALLGCFAEGRTVVSGAGELRHKESDRIATVVEGLRGIGAQIEALEEGFAVRGTGGLRGGTLHAHGDHRLAMLGAVAGLASREGVEVVGAGAAAVSYPGFEADLRSLLSAET